MINWKFVCLSKEKGRLGIQDLASMNKALLVKWVRKFAGDEDSAWKKFIGLKNGTEEGEWFTSEARGNLGGSLWKAISIEVLLVRQNCTFVLGDGSRIRLWEDAWCGDQ